MSRGEKWAAFIVVALLAISPFVTLGYQKILAPEFEKVRRDVYEESLSYNRGKVEHLNWLCRDFRLSEEEGHRSVLAATIRTEVSTYQFERLPTDLQGCARQAEETR